MSSEFIDFIKKCIERLFAMFRCRSKCHDELTCDCTSDCANNTQAG